MTNTTIPDKVRDIMNIVIDHGYEIYIIGGFVRDTMFDEILKIFPHGKVIGRKERQAKILTVIVKGVEVSQYRANGDRKETGVSLDDHLATCDFTMNAMAMNIDRELINSRYGMCAIRDKRVECVGDPVQRINEDKLRALRAVRFAVKYRFMMEKGLARVIWDTDISDLPVERVREEMLKILMYPDGLERLDFSGLLQSIVPEFQALDYMDGGGRHAETVDVHMYKAQTIACGLTDNPMLVLACAFHDIGKADAFKRDGEKVSFHGHDKAGEKVMYEIMERMKFSKADTTFVCTLVAEHMFGYHTDASTKTLVKHFARLEKAGVSIEDYMVMQYSDNQANTQNPRIKFGDYLNKSRLYKKWYELRFSNTPFRVSDLAISGNDLMDIGIPGGKVIGDILGNIFESVVRGDLENKRHALMHYIRHRKWKVCDVETEANK
jgi:tRNA nucleotidyltransferase (CCA-adding enzyme)